MAIILADYRSLAKPKEVETGTCDLCFGTSYTDEPVFVFKDVETGETLEVDGYMWSWGDLFEIDIENIPDFAQWIRSQDLSLEDVDSYGKLCDLDYIHDDYE